MIATAAGFAIGLVGLVVLALPVVFVWADQRKLRRQGFDRHRKPPTPRVSHTFDPEHAVTFRGGSRVGGANSTAPGTKLTFDDQWARMDASLTIWIPRSKVLDVRTVAGLLGRGLRFASTDGTFDGVLFWTFSPAIVLAALRDHGWPVAEELTTQVPG